MDNYCSPQWVDFTSTQDMPLDDYFEKNHEDYSRKECFELPKIKIVSSDNVNLKEISETRINDAKLEAELNIIKSTPIKVIYSPSSLYGNKKREFIKKITYDDILDEAIETIEHCVSAKVDIFKKPISIKNNISKSLKFNTGDNDQVNVLPNTPSDIDNPAISPTVNCVTYLSIPSKEEQNISLEKSSNSSSKNKRSKPVTYQCRRQSVIFRRSSNKFISLAAAVHKFQNETPERFHTKCNKNLKAKTASVKRYSCVSRKSVLAKSNIKRRSVPALSQKEGKDLKPDKVNELSCDQTNQKHITETPNTSKPRRSYLNYSTKHTARNNKHVVSTIVANNSSEIILKKEKILFFDIPIDTKKKSTTRPMPFSFEYRDKTKKEFKSTELQLEDNKSVNNVKSQSIEKKTGTASVGMQNKASISKKNDHRNQLGTSGETSKYIGTANTLKKNSHNTSKNNENKITSNNQNLKTTMKTNKSKSVSLESYEKTEDKNKENKLSLNKDTEQLKKQSTLVPFKNSLDKSKGINKTNTTKYNNQIKDTNRIKKQSLSLLSKEKSRSGNKTETIRTKEDSNMIKKECSTCNDTDTNTEENENKCPNISASKNDTSSHQIKNMKPKCTIGMNSYERGKQRHEYDEKIRQKIQMQEEMRQKMEAEKLAHEKLEIAMLRKQLEVRAKPMPVYKPLLRLKSTKPLTEPQSPAWSYKNNSKKKT